MKIIPLNEDTSAYGEIEFAFFLRAVMVGRGDRTIYDAGMRRDGGVKALYGAVIACLDYGINEKTGVICAVARATRCRRSTVETFLTALTGSDPEQSLFREEQGLLWVHNRPLSARAPEFLLAA
ncbi:hypothetical protein [Sphingomonas desiccabilis]|uniref:Uncharacterized protein n=1 Tax=Sphingomonas desiccabilis TaxID=429134 RepID=A0A4Q2IZH0_9SPHN|nr:hypothetical protein [Sphingomonas desiccabilis]MBB3909729.1 hypothetical protein [Sphingomonas desiccabilis]RXZ34422.1 hypothetical protein EO081_01650 [Sphingomonas desiccabilis]